MSPSRPTPSCPTGPPRLAFRLSIRSIPTTFSRPSRRPWRSSGGTWTPSPRRPDTATFGNTVEALEQSGVTLSNVRGVFSNLSTAETNAQLQEINLQIAPRLSALDDDIRLNPALFARIKARVGGPGGAEPVAGAAAGCSTKRTATSPATAPTWTRRARPRYGRSTQRLAELAVTFDQHLLHETNAYRLVIADGRDLAGLPQAVVAAASEAAATAGLPGRWLFTLHAPSIWPFLEYADNRELRREILQAYTSRADHGDEWDNKAIVSRLASLRLERSRLLGYATYADFNLEEAMAKTPARVYDLLERLWAPARARALDGGGRAAGRGSAERSRRSRSSRGTGATTRRRSARRATTSTCRRSGPTSR